MEATDAIVRYSTLLCVNIYRIMGIDSCQVDDYKFVRYIGNKFCGISLSSK